MIRSGRALLATAIVCALFNPTAVSQAQAAASSLSWGIRSSFDNYTGGATALNEGATRSGNAFNFPLVSNTYDSEQQRSEIQFRGEVVYKKYCRDNSAPLTSVCDLDLSFKNPKVVIDDEGSFVYATVSSRQYLKNEVYAPAEAVPIARLHTPSGTFSNAGGTVSWSDLPATLTPEGAKMFSEFYDVGEGLDPVSLTYPGTDARPATDTGGLAVSSAAWTSPASNYDRTHKLYQAGNSVLAYVQGKGLYLLGPDLEVLASREIDLSGFGISTFDPGTGTLYFAAADSTAINAVTVTDTTISEPSVVATAAEDVRALAYHPSTKEVVALSAAKKGAAHLNVVESGGLRSIALPSTEELLGVTVDSFSDSIWTMGYNFAFDPSLIELLPMDDGTYILNSSADITVSGEDRSRKDLLVSLSTTDADRPAVYMEGSHHGATRYLQNLRGNGRTLVRFNQNTSAENSFYQVLEYSNRAVTVGEVLTTPQAGWADVTWDSNGSLVALSGVTGSLHWLDGSRDPLTIPHGRETSNNEHAVLLATTDGSIYVPSLDESRGDHIEYFVLRKVYDPTFVPPAPSGNEDQLHQARITAAERAVSAARQEYEASPVGARQAQIDALNAALAALAQLTGDTYVPVPPDASAPPSADPSTPPTTEPGTAPQPGSSAGPVWLAALLGVLGALGWLLTVSPFAHLFPFPRS